ncbi:hypothetical protein PBRA_009716 [Plasmodiophora brassicae]|uniref:Uncharacterized protein n=1 Tax=Plasmodiophora brassicae TaxID=37360 RepID=A0A0G4ILY2_PLABS|nr:hypothetical protein PBRA_009716 [Plasmodiophora brassicae]
MASWNRPSMSPVRASGSRSTQSTMCFCSGIGLMASTTSLPKTRLPALQAVLGHQTPQLESYRLDPVDQEWQLRVHGQFVRQQLLRRLQIVRHSAPQLCNLLGHPHLEVSVRHLLLVLESQLVHRNCLSFMKLEAVPD